MAVTSVCVVASNTNTRAGTLGYSSIALGVDTVTEVAETDSSANCSNAGALVKLDSLERLEVDLHSAILATRAKACIRVST